jgi:spermidine synthase
MERRLVAQAVEDGITVELFEHVGARDGALEVVADGRTVMASDQRRADASFAELALGPWQGRDDISVVLGGLGMGFTLRALLDRPGVVRVDVVEVSRTILAWDASHFAALNGAAAQDPRVRVHQAELLSFLGARRTPDLPEDGWFAALVDTDEFPTWLSREGNRALYEDDGLRLLEGALRGGGVLALWTTGRDDVLLRRLHGRLQAVTRIGVASDLGLEYVHRGRRAPRRAS